MDTNVNLAAPLGVIALMGTGLVLGVIGVLLIYSLAVRRFGRAKLAALALLIAGALYLALLLAFAFASSDRVLARGGEKHFCEIDCHLAYSVVDSKQTKSIGNVPEQVTARGVFTAVTIKTRFDETTINPNRGNAMLYPNSRVLTLVDDQGRRYSPAIAGQRALEATGAAGTPLPTPLRPGESYTTTVVFDLPADAGNPTLLINEGEWVTHFVIGHENSPFHGKTRFQL